MGVRSPEEGAVLLQQRLVPAAACTLLSGQCMPVGRSRQLRVVPYKCRVYPLPTCSAMMTTEAVSATCAPALVTGWSFTSTLPAGQGGTAAGQ